MKELVFLETYINEFEKAKNWSYGNSPNEYL